VNRRYVRAIAARERRASPSGAAWRQLGGVAGGPSLDVGSQRPCGRRIADDRPPVGSRRIWFSWP
jgi:hypothetical protein